jgi:ATP-dependent Clp protease ATP-binding subunit ClpB
METEKDKLLHMEDRLRRRVVGQEEAIAAVSNAVRRARSGLQDPNRPIGSFIFMGPTGVGKTELARALAEFLFDDEHAMIRIDMSEFMEKHTVSRLIGAPPGYVGY